MNEQLKKLVAKVEYRQLNPTLGWVKLGVLMLLPSVAFRFGWGGVIALVAATAIAFFFVRLKENKNDFMYQSVRGLWIEYKGKAKCDNVWMQKLLGATWKKAAWFLGIAVFDILVLAFIVRGNLIMGSLLYYPTIVAVLMALTYYDRLSIANPSGVSEEPSESVDFDENEESKSDSNSENPESQF